MEIEIDAADGRDFSESPLRQGEMPAGSERVAEIVSSLGLEVQRHGWRHNHNNSVWVCKPDSSCGIELCSPVLDEGRLDEIAVVMDALARDEALTCGPNCAFHVHVDVSSLAGDSPESSPRLCAALAWWIKCEAVLFDSVPARRRDSRFCRCIGMTDLFDHEDAVVPVAVVDKLRDKYLSANTHHLVARKRRSVEFRIMEGTKDSGAACNWVRFLLNFVRRAAAAGPPEDYRWVGLPEVESLVQSGGLFLWLAGRIERNASSAASRFWASRVGGFGETPSFIGPRRDT